MPILFLERKCVSMEEKGAKEEERALKALNDAAQKDQKAQAENKPKAEKVEEKKAKDNNKEDKNVKKTDNKKDNNNNKKSKDNKGSKLSRKEMEEILASQLEKKRKITAEVTAIIVACVSILTIIGVYFGGGGLIGQGISAFLKGLFGFGAYILPIALVGACVYVFFNESKVFDASKVIIAVAMFFVMLAFLHLIHINSKNPVRYDSFMLFTKEMYKAGDYYNGGLLGAYLGALLYKAMGKASSIIFVVMGFVCLGIFLTGESLFDGIKRLWQGFSSYFVFKDKDYEEELLEEEGLQEDNSEDNLAQRNKENSALLAKGHKGFKLFEKLSDKLGKNKADKDENANKEEKSTRDKIKEQIHQEKAENKDKENSGIEIKTQDKKIYREIPKPTIININPENKQKESKRLDIALDTVLSAEREHLEPAKINKLETDLPDFIKNREKFSYEKFLESGQNKPKINGLENNQGSTYVDSAEGGYVPKKAEVKEPINNEEYRPNEPVPQEEQRVDNQGIIDDNNIGEYLIDVSGLHQNSVAYEAENVAVESLPEPMEGQADMDRPLSPREQLDRLINSDDNDEEAYYDNSYQTEMPISDIKASSEEFLEDSTRDINVANINAVANENVSADMAENNGFRADNAEDYNDGYLDGGYISDNNDYEDNNIEENQFSQMPDYENEMIENMSDTSENIAEDIIPEDNALNDDIPPWEDSSVNVNQSMNDEIARSALIEANNRENRLNNMPNSSFKAQNNANRNMQNSFSQNKVQNTDTPVIIKADESKTVDKLNVEEKAEYVFPKLEFLGKNPNLNNSKSSEIELLENSKILVKTLASFNVDATVIEISKGPAVTRYELSIADGIKVSKILNLADNLALSLAATSIRIEAPIPGKSAVGIEIPNKEVTSVYLSEVICDEKFQKFPSKLAFGLGKDIAGNVVVTNIAKMPHMLIAGATGSGKSVCINTLITSILYKASPDEVRLIMVDPKVVELSVYNGIPHLLIPVVTEADKAAGALNWAVHEMMERYKQFAETGTRNLEGYNKVLEANGQKKLPQIVIIIDELADLMMVAAKEVEAAICRLAQLARAAGLHLIIATQRPSVDVITGLIKANIPSRIAFAVSSGTDSRTIIDTVGAEKLLGKGDMLFKAVDMNKPLRVQGAFVTDNEVEEIVSFLKENNPAQYDEEVITKIATMREGDSSSSGGGGDVSDEMTDEVIQFIVRNGKCSTSLIQRKFRLGYNRAARIVEELEDRGIIGPENGSKPREVLMDKYQMEEYFTRNAGY